MGHMTLTTQLASAIKSKTYILSDHDYEKFSNAKTVNTTYIRLSQQKHSFSIAGCIKYQYRDEIIHYAKEKKIGMLVFSTMFDACLMRDLRREKIRTVLISYPLRDTHRKAFLLRKYHLLFNHILTLQGIENVKRLFPNEQIVSPPIKFEDTKSKTSKIKKILITAGGGGRPSSNLFFGLMKNLVPALVKKMPWLRFTIIKGNYEKNFSLPNTRIIGWSRSFQKLLKEYDLIISEAGYFTVLNILSTSKPSILIPGARRIDNQELRAFLYDEAGCGIAILPEESEQVYLRRLNTVLANPQRFEDIYENSQRAVRTIAKHVSVVDALLNIIDN